MAKMMGNVFGQAAANRKAEQESIEESIKAGEKPAGRGRPPKPESEKSITVSIRMSEKTRTKLKVYAVTHGKTISDVITEFVNGLEIYRLLEERPE